MKINDQELQAEREAASNDDRAYARFNNGRFDFCPHKDLNLPSSYDEVLSRFNRLQGERAMEVLN